MRMTATIVAAISLLVSAFSANAVASNAAPDIAPGWGSPGIASIPFKAHADSAIAIDPSSVGTDRTVVTLHTAVGSTDLAVAISMPGRRTTSVPVRAAAGPVRVELPGVDIGSAGSVRVVLTGVTAEGSDLLAVDEVWFDTVDRRVIVSDVGVEDLGFLVDRARRDSGSMSSVDTDEHRIDDPLTKSVAVADADTCSPGRVCASGTARWTDRIGGTHPVRAAYVDLVEIVSGDLRVRATVLTDDDGGYDAGFDASGPVDVFVQLRAAGPGFEFLVDRGGLLETRAKFSTIHEGVAPGSSIIGPFEMGNVEADDTVFSLHAAMTYAIDYLPTLRSSPLPDVEIIFPAANTFYSPSTQRVSMLEPDRWDWDVMLHEYGHFVAELIGIEDNPGGSHSGGENLGDRLPKDEANKLAWGEGWPTYFAVSTLLESDAAALGIPGIGDTSYQDTEDTSISDDLEADARLGEDNELTVANVLWDLYDTPADGADRVALGTRRVWDVLDLGEPETLSEAVALFAPDRGARTNDVNCILGQMNVAPQLATTPGVAMPPLSPNLSWTSGNGGFSGRNDRFVVEYRNADSTVVLFAVTTTGTSYRAPTAEWDRLVADSGGAVNVSVIGTATGRFPVTGPYRSCSQTFATDTAQVADDIIVPITPARYVDTRPGERTFDGIDVGEGPRRAGEISRFQIAGRGQLGDRVRAAVINLTAVRPSGDGFVTAFDCQAPMPPSSSLNHAPGVDVANEVVVSLSGAGEICVYTAAGTHLVIDVVGYVEMASPLVTVTPARLLETRSIASGTTDGRSAGTGRLRGDSQVTVRIAGRAGVADDAVAAVLNVAAVQPDRTGFVTVHPCEPSRPLASSLNVVRGVDRADEIIAPLDESGNVCLYTSGATDAIIDVVGYVPPGSGYTPITPARFVDTRPGERTVDGRGQGGGRRGDGETLVVQITGRNDIPVGAEAVIAYVTAVDPIAVGFVTVWPCSESRPLASSLNNDPGVDGGNELVARLDDEGRICVFTRGAAHVTVDVAGYIPG